MFHLFTWRQVTQACFLEGNVLNRMYMGFSHGSASKEPACKAGDLGSIPGFGRSTGEGNGHPLQYSGLENSMERGAWQATVHGVAKSRTQLSKFHLTFKRNRSWDVTLQKCLVLNL